MCLSVRLSVCFSLRRSSAELGEVAPGADAAVREHHPHVDRGAEGRDVPAEGLGWYQDPQR